MAAASLAPMLAWSGVSNDIPSCYEANKIQVSRPKIDTEIIVLVDQTTPLDESLQQQVRENVGRLVSGNSAFAIGNFSSFGQGRYLELQTAGIIEGGLQQPVRDSISVKTVRNFDQCMSAQLEYARKTAAKALNKALAGTSADLKKSDILGALKEISGRVRQSEAKSKILFLVSDMLENSSITSFYSNQNVRLIEPSTEFEKAKLNKMLGDFGGAKVFVLGAGLVQELKGGKNKDSGVYRDPKSMSALKLFWEKYFEASNATLVEFGAPALINPVK